MDEAKLEEQDKRWQAMGDLSLHHVEAAHKELDRAIQEKASNAHIQSCAETLNLLIDIYHRFSSARPTKS